MMPETITILAAVPAGRVKEYQDYFAKQKDFSLQTAVSFVQANEMLANADVHVDVLVVDQQLGDAYALITDLRHTYPRMLIVLIDEEADFGIPGQADAINTGPFTETDLVKQINQLLAERRVATLRSDDLPAARVFAKHLRNAAGLLGKLQAAVDACLEMGYDYVAFYQPEPGNVENIIMRAQAGPAAIQAVAPKEARPADLMVWVIKNGQSRIAGPDDRPTHPLVARGRLGAVVCVPVALGANLAGALAACRDRPGSITQENALMLELIGMQLATAIRKESS